MKAEQHHKILAFSLIGHSLLLAFAAVWYFYPVVKSILGNFYSGDAIQQMISASLIILAVVYGLFFVVLVLPQLIGGLVFLGRNNLSKICGIIAVSFALISIPLGTIIGIYGLWFLLSEKGKSFYSE